MYALALAPAIQRSNQGSKPKLKGGAIVGPRHVTSAFQGPGPPIAAIAVALHCNRDPAYGVDS